MSESGLVLIETSRFVAYTPNELQKYCRDNLEDTDALIELGKYVALQSIEVEASEYPARDELEEDLELSRSEAEELENTLEDLRDEHIRLQQNYKELIDDMRDLEVKHAAKILSAKGAIDD